MYIRLYLIIISFPKSIMEIHIIKTTIRYSMFLKSNV